MYRLVFLSGRNQGKRLVVRQAVTLVGQGAECHLLLPDDPLLSSRHARFEEKRSGIFLTSLSAENPVQRNGAPLLDTRRLAHNDVLIIGQTQIQFQYIIAPNQRFRPSHGWLQPITMIMILAILALEASLLVFLVHWPQHLIRPETEREDLARAEELRAVLEAKKNAETGTVAQVDASASVVALPGTSSAAPTSPEVSAASAPMLKVMEEADFVPANTNTFVAEPPPVSVADPKIEKAQRQLAEAVSAAQFADYSKAFRLLNQIHQTYPGFIPALVEHARLLEARGDLDSAQQRWTQILGIAPTGSPFRTLANQERQRLEGIQSLQTQILRSSETPDLTTMPRHLHIVNPDVQKMPSDTDIAEMRVLNATVEMTPGAPLFKDALVQVFVTFYDIGTDDTIRPSRAITPPSPIVLGSFSDRRSAPLQITYVIPRGLRAQEERKAGGPTSYYGYTLHLFAGKILQDAVAKPKKLLDLPIRFPTSSP